MTGRGGDGAYNLVNATYEKGASTVIGFEEEIIRKAANVWCDGFFESLIIDGTNNRTLYDVCDEAYNILLNDTAHNIIFNKKTLEKYVLKGSTELPKRR